MAGLLLSCLNVLPLVSVCLGGSGTLEYPLFYAAASDCAVLTALGLFRALMT